MEENNIMQKLCDELVNEIKEQDKTALDHWSQQNQDNHKFHRLINKLKISPVIEQKGEDMKPAILLQINKRIDRIKRYKSFVRSTTVAAVFLILVSLTGYFSYERGYKKVNSQLIEMVNPPGMLSTVTLPDKSIVILNAGTTITYPNAFNAKNREVFITGEAYFEVAHKENHPFIVKTEQMDVKVLGTKFNIKAYKEDDWVEVSLNEGKVGINIENQTTSILDPGQQALYNKQTKSLLTRNINITHYISWKDGAYYFRALPLKDITSQLERIFNVRIFILSPQLQQITITGDFVRNENLEQILRVIEIAADKRLKYRIEDDAIYIEENK